MYSTVTHSHCRSTLPVVFDFSEIIEVQMAMVRLFMIWPLKAQAPALPAITLAGATAWKEFTNHTQGDHSSGLPLLGNAGS